MATATDKTAQERHGGSHAFVQAYGVRSHPGMTRDGDVYVSGDMKVAWFKDPDGNILKVAGR